MEVRLTVLPGQTTVSNIELRRSVIALDALVVTGTGGEFERKQLGNTIATVAASDVANAPIATFSELLQAREPSLVGLTSGGVAGEGMRIRIRGSNSLAMSSEPVVYMDGIRVDNAGTLLGGGWSTASRLDDINPEAIERVEILKGAAAGTLYGSEASSGVIQIFTKRGQSGRPRFSFRIEQGISRYPADRIKPNAGFARDAATAAKMGEMFGMEVEPYEIVERSFATDMFETGWLQSYSADISGGSSDVLYYLAGRLTSEDGPYGSEQLGPTRDFNRRYQATSSLTLFPRERLSIRGSANFSDIRQHAPLSNNNPYAPHTIALAGKPELANCDASSLDSSQIFGETTPVCSGAGNPRGSPLFFGGSTVRNNAQGDIRSDTEHFSGSVSATYNLASTVDVTATLGIDAVNERQYSFWPYGANIDRPQHDEPWYGEKHTRQRSHRELTFDARLSWGERFGDNFSSEFVLGTQGFFADERSVEAGDTNFPLPGLNILGAGTDPYADEEILSKANLGILTQEQVGFFDVAYLTVGGRWDRNSTFGTSAGAAFYPKASISVVPSEISSWNSSLLSTLRLRAAYGRSGLQPGSFDKMTTYGPVPLSSGSGIRPENLGNADLRPERSAEVELGAEVGLLDDRASVEVTYWDRAVTDALIARQFAASGFINRQMFNIGRLEAHGWEIKLDALLLNRDNMAVRLFANAAYLNEVITDMGGAPPIKVGGSYPRYRNTLAEGYAPGTYFGVQLIPVCGPDIERTCYTPGSTVPFDSNNDGQPDSESEFTDYLTSSPSISLDDPGLAPLQDDEDGDGIFDDHRLGKPTPDWQGSFGADTSTRCLSIAQATTGSRT
jgi:TonB-dependent SusC/RagA subfamily outer membrane receptor